MVMHGLACSTWIASADRFHNVGMLAGGKLAVVSDVDGSKHEALHLTAYLGDSTHQQAVTTQPCDADVEFCIGFDKAFVLLRSSLLYCIRASFVWRSIRAASAQRRAATSAQNPSSSVRYAYISFSS